MEALWKYLVEVQYRWDFPWIIGGDFGMVFSAHECSGKNPSRACLEEFKDILDKFNLLDLPPFVGKWTWVQVKRNAKFFKDQHFFIGFACFESQPLKPLQKLSMHAVSNNFPLCLVAIRIISGTLPIHI